MNCISLWRISARRSHSMSWMHPQKPSTNALGKPSREQGSWCRWPGGHLSERGVGSPGTIIQTSCPTQPDGGWAPQVPPPQPLTPTQPNADVGHLINTLTSGLHLGAPRINTFSGKAMPGKTEFSFEQWYHEVQCVNDHYPESVVWVNIVRSQKGAAADMARYMGPSASISNILQKISHFWDDSVIWHVNTKFLQSYPGEIMRKCPLLPQG